MEQCNDNERYQKLAEMLEKLMQLLLCYIYLTLYMSVQWIVIKHVKRNKAPLKKLFCWIFDFFGRKLTSAFFHWRSLHEAMMFNWFMKFLLEYSLFGKIFNKNEWTRFICTSMDLQVVASLVSLFAYRFLNLLHLKIRFSKNCMTLSLVT